MATEKTQGNQSSEKLLGIFEYLIASGEPMKLQDIAAGMGMNASTTLRFLAALVKCGYVRQDKDTLKYEPTMKICALANRINKEEFLVKTARPYMKKLSEIFGESVCLGVCENNRVIYVEVLRIRNQSLMAVQAVGNSAPMYCNGIGKLFLSDMDDEKLKTYLKEVEREAFTEYTLTEEEQLTAEIAKIRKQGYAFDNQEKEIGARCLAFPVYSADGRMIAGISVTGPYSRLTDEALYPKINDFRRITEELSAENGFVGC